jgi:hypothetical protein
MLDDNALLAGFAFQFLHRLDLLDVEPHQAHSPIDVPINDLGRLAPRHDLSPDRRSDAIGNTVLPISQEGHSNNSRASASVIREISPRAARSRPACPVVLSFLPSLSAGLGSPAPQGTFSAHIGYVREMTGSEVRDFARAAGLDVLMLNEDDNWPQAVTSGGCVRDAC